MSRVKVTTLRSVHIGNGNLLQNNTDFVVDGNNIYVIDPEKVLDIIGIEKLDYWVSAIERRENLKEFLGRVGKNCLPNEYASRVIDNYSSIQNDKTPRCPHCHSTNIKSISGLNRGASIAMWGIFSKKINKSFECKNCGYTW